MSSALNRMLPINFPPAANIDGGDYDDHDHDHHHDDHPAKRKRVQVKRKEKIRITIYCYFRVDNARGENKQTHLMHNVNQLNYWMNKNQKTKNFGLLISLS